MTSEILSLQNISRTYSLAGETVTALDNVSLTVNEGDFISIIGPSGSGKSTLMNIIGCLDRPSSGSYWLQGTNVETMQDSELATIRNEKIGFIFQNFNLLNRLTTLENVELPLMYRGMNYGARLSLALESLERVGLGNRANHYPNQLSGGQQQRVAIARALSGNPPLLLADEPTGALDSKTSNDIMNILLELNQKGHTIIVITHDMDVARKAKRIVQIHDGQISEKGGEIHENPSSVEVGIS
ncbi:ABC transporter ATP-binding protein [Peribacillus alkalitolerans]|uniref:ABC transporter ATP-binding protein n=1 Tax=Peribacillus alkalitolerans TaxID=1550385 RepID=UPI0013D57AEC|nr:ABC transporter ATP-binding protein [Peribacillus alkalitolerans]